MISPSAEKSPLSNCSKIHARLACLHHVTGRAYGTLNRERLRIANTAACNLTTALRFFLPQAPPMRRTSTNQNLRHRHTRTFATSFCTSLDAETKRYTKKRRHLSFGTADPVWFGLHK